MTPNPYEELTSEQLKTLLRSALTETPTNFDIIRQINAELAGRPDQAETQKAWEKFLSGFVQPLP